jgi:hypothetical protein
MPAKNSNAFTPHLHWDELLAYQDDINRAVGALDGGDADVLCNVLAAYGPASTEDSVPLEGALQKLASKLAVGDKRAGEVLRRIISWRSTTARKTATSKCVECSIC